MKTKIIVLFFAAIMIFFYSCCNSAQNNTSEDQQIRDMLKEFYTSYMTQISEGKDLKTARAIPKKYCTIGLLKAIENDKELDYDPLLSAQDADVVWLKTLSIKKNIEIPNGYIITYESTSKYDNEKASIKLTVVKEKDGYKIDSVESEDGKKYGGRK